MQHAKKEFDVLLQPAITAIDKGEVFEKSRDEILKEIIESVVK